MNHSVGAQVKQQWESAAHSLIYLAYPLHAERSGSGSGSTRRYITEPPSSQTSPDQVVVG